jgi:uncharacterized protein YbaP (TraB family)
MLGLAAGAATAPPPIPTGALDELQVIGERPGPGLWRISKGGRELWILATLEPLPKAMVWRSRTVDRRIAGSQALLAPPRVSADVGFFRGLTLLPSLLRARHSPDGRTLEATLPHDLYIRWLALRVKYLGRSSDDERMRPMLAAFDLYTHALDASGLTSDERVWSDIEHTARANHVPIVPVTLKLTIDDPKQAIRELGEIPRDAEISCLRTTMERLETDIQPMVRRAELWARGDVEALRAMPHPPEEIACLNAFLSVPQLRNQFLKAKDELMDVWLEAAERALDEHASSFAVLPIAEVLWPDGWLANLRARGYTIEDPGSLSE